MSNYSKQMVLAIANDLENSNIPNYDNFGFKEHEESAVFEVSTNLKLTGKKILTCIFIDCDDEGDDRVINTTILNDKISNQFIEEAKKLIDILNEYWCDEVSFFIEENAEDAFVILHREIDYFDEDEIFDEDNEDDLENFLSITASGVAAFEVLTKSLYLIINDGYSVEKAIKENSFINNILEDTNKSDGDDFGELLDKYFNLKEQAKSGDVSAQFELAESLKTLFPDEDTEEDDMENSAAYWYKKAAKKGHETASFCVAVCYHEGIGTRKSLGDASEWYKKQIDRSLALKSQNTDIIKKSLQAIYNIDSSLNSTMTFPVKYGESTFETEDEIIDNLFTNPDALGLFSQCSILGIHFPKRGTYGIDGLFEAANKGSIDAILGLGRLYESGFDFLAKDFEAAATLYKYAYSLNNIDALHSLGLLLFNHFEKKEIGLSMMRKADELGSKIANTQLELIKDRTANIKALLFSEIPKSEFNVDEFEVSNYMQLYFVNLTSENDLKEAILNIMCDMKPETFSVIMNEFRVKYLRKRKLMHFSDKIDFLALFDKLVAEGLVEANQVEEYGIAENTIYSAKASSKKMKTVTLDWDI